MPSGNILHTPDTMQRSLVIGEDFHCECHERMGNDFYFLPIGSCLRTDKMCTNSEGQSL